MSTPSQFHVNASGLIQLSPLLFPAGEKSITRIVSFKPFSSRDYHAATSPDVEDSNFEGDLCEWLVQEIPNIRSMPGRVDGDRLQMFLMEFPDRVEEVVEKIYVFIKTEKLTHYISSISLGAVEYSVSTTTRSTLSAGSGAGIGNDFVAGGGAGTKGVREKSVKTSRDQRIGDLGVVARGKGEAVVGYEILPVYTLVRQEAVKKAVQKAVKFYLERESESGEGRGECGVSMCIMWYGGILK